MPGCALTSVACGAMVNTPLDGASAGMSMSTVYGPAVALATDAGEMVVSNVATTGVGHTGPLVPDLTSNPSFVTPTPLVAETEMRSLVPRVRLSPWTGARSFTLGPLVIVMATVSRVTLPAMSVTTPYTSSLPGWVSTGVFGDRKRRRSSVSVR